VSGKLTKGLQRADGLILPQIDEGEIEIPRCALYDTPYMEFCKIEQMEKHLCKTFDEIADEFCVLQN
jgi:hypothetical protein